ncbi:MULTISPECIES: metallophosphoesterase family protein [unclassified Methylobacterium]|uniref:metallophosphoesterase family protein n=1 Tax=unclassified Methylobacterium TaxID=2615210 RepID=UPI0036FEDAAE
MTKRSIDPRFPTGRVLFTSDTHFGHHGAIGHSDRPFRDVEEMNRLLVEAWNATVGKRDTVFHLGDFAHKASPETCAEIFSRLNGQKHLIRGNHDRKRTLELPWESIHERLTVRVGGHKVILDHYPMRSWDSAYHGSLHLFGHVHGKFEGTSQSCDVGVDLWQYRPVTLDEILPRLAANPTRPEERLGPDPEDDDAE